MTKKQQNLLILAGLGIGGYYLYTKSQQPKMMAPVAVQPQTQPAAGGLFGQLLTGVVGLIKGANSKDKTIDQKIKTHDPSLLEGYSGSLSGCGGSLGCDEYGSLG